MGSSAIDHLAASEADYLLCPEWFAVSLKSRISCFKILFSRFNDAISISEGLVRRDGMKLHLENLVAYFSVVKLSSTLF